MAKKKPQSAKKHRFKHAEPNPAVHEQQMAEASLSATTHVQASKPAVMTAGRDFSYVSHDLRRIFIFATVLFALELVGWYVINHTSFGPSLYTWVKV